MSSSLGLKDFREIPLLDGFKSSNYVETLEALPKIDGLHAIRLVTILPGTPTSELHCSMGRYFIDEVSNYECLSYTWKSATFTQPLVLNKEHFLITSNVEAALRHLRYADKERTVWIDSICIDQRNTIEKNAQVRLMGSIYQQADRVLAWIGLESEPDDDTEGRALDVAGAFDLALDIEKEGWEKYPEVVERHSELALFSLTKLTDRSYFRRQWVIQEISLAKKIVVICGKHTIEWNALSAAAEGMAAFGQDPRASLLFSGSSRIWDLFGIRAMEFCREKSVSGHFTNDLIEILRTSRGREVTDPRDMVYSLLGICGPESMDIDIDYRKSVLRLYKEVAKSTILRSLNLDFLRLCDHWSRDEGLPSWAPNWTHIWAGQWQIRSLGFQAWPPTEGRLDPHSDDVEFSEDLDVLTIKGHLIDEIILCQDITTMPDMPDNSIGDNDVYNQLRETLSASEKLCTKITRPDQTHDARRREFVEALFCGFTGGAKTEFSELDFAAWYDEILSGSVPDADRKSWNMYSLKLLRFLCDARFFITKGAIIGLAERVCNTQSGDVVVTFKGASVESIFVIRPRGPRFELINGIFLHFSSQEQSAHEKLVVDLNKGKLKTDKYSLI